MRAISILLFSTLFLSLPAFSQSNQATMGGTSSIHGQSLLAPGPASTPSASAVALSDPPIGGTCATHYQSTTGNTTITYTLGLYPGCTNIPPSVWTSTANTLLATITPRNTSGTPGSGTGFKIVILCQGMSVALAECSSFASVTGALTNVRISNQAVSNNDLPVYSTPVNWATGVQPDACIAEAANGSAGQCEANGLGNPPANSGDRMTTNLSSGGLNALQVEVGLGSNLNGTLHQYLRGSCSSNCMTSSAIYYNAPPMDGQHQILDSTQVNLLDASNVAFGYAGWMRGNRARFPNEVFFWFHGRQSATGCTLACPAPEPQNYESTLAIQQVISAQICQMGGAQGNCPSGQTSGSANPFLGDLCPLVATCGTAVSPLLGWEYVDSSVSHDGVTHDATFWGTMNVAHLADANEYWCNPNKPGNASAPCNGTNDYGSDNEHLTTAGGVKAGTLINKFFINSPYTQPWFN